MSIMDFMANIFFKKSTYLDKDASRYFFKKISIIEQVCWAVTPVNSNKAAESICC